MGTQRFQSKTDSKQAIILSLSYAKMQPMKEAASNMAASAKSGMDKTKATVQEKVERMTAHNPIEKDMATQRKGQKINQAELNKQEAHAHNAAAKPQAATTGHQVGLHHQGHLHDVAAGTHPVGTDTGLGGTTDHD